MRSNIIIDFEGENRYPVFFMSDLHSDDNDFDEELLFYDLEKAKRNRAKVLIGGDIYSLLLAKDMKRFTGSRAKVSNGKAIDSYVNSAIFNALDKLSPYADIIEMIGVGNHESSLIKFNGIDPVHLLVYELNKVKTNGRIQQMGYKGFITLRFRRQNTNSYDFVNIWADHGRGSGAVVTKGAIDMTRATTFVEGVDVIWLQHKHVRWADPSIKRWYPKKNGIPGIKKIVGMITGTYQKDLVIDDFEKSHGYVIHFGEERSWAPQGTGGIQIDFEPSRSYTKEGRQREIKKHVIMEC